MQNWHRKGTERTIINIDIIILSIAWVIVFLGCQKARIFARRQVRLGNAPGPCHPGRSNSIASNAHVIISWTMDDMQTIQSITITDNNRSIPTFEAIQKRKTFDTDRWLNCQIDKWNRAECEYTYVTLNCSHAMHLFVWWNWAHSQSSRLACTIKDITS